MVGWVICLRVAPLNKITNTGREAGLECRSQFNFRYKTSFITEKEQAKRILEIQEWSSDKMFRNYILGVIGFRQVGGLTEEKRIEDKTLKYFIIKEQETRKVRKSLTKSCK